MSLSRIQETRSKDKKKNVSVNSNGKPDVSKMDKNEPVMYAKYSYMKWGTVHCLEQYNKRVGSRCKNKDLL